MGNVCCNRNKQQKKIVLLLVGLDNAGKSVAVKGLAGESLDSVIPTVGLSVIYLKYNNYTVKIFDLGGGSNIRGIWQRYFVDVHGVIFVVDSSDYYRLDEARDVLSNLLSHEKITGKPILLLANKQDRQEALDELDIVEKLQLEVLVNKRQCPTLVEMCSATEITPKSKLDPGIEKGYHWLLNYIVRNYNNLNSRVEHDVKQQEMEEDRERLEKIEKLRRLYETTKTDDDIIESYSDYDRKINGNVTNVREESIEDTNDIFYIHTGVINNTGSFSSSKSNESFPCAYYEQDVQARPKSATQWVKHQLELENARHTTPFAGLITNKTTPANLYGIPRSAGERRQRTVNNVRTLKSAGDSSLFTYLPNSVMDTTGELFHVNNFQKMPQLKWEDEERWAQRRVNPVNVEE